MTGQLVLPPERTIKKFDIRAARAFAEEGGIVPLDPDATVESNVNGDVTISWEGGVSPFIVGWGDGEPENQDAPPAHHLYHVDGDYTITVLDSVGQTATVPVTITGSLPAADPQAPPATVWSTHAAAEAWLDAFTERTGLGAPLDWSPTATLAQKYAAALQLWEDWQDSQP